MNKEQETHVLFLIEILINIDKNKRACVSTPSNRLTHND
jgi:hypothetical protein